jgi:protein-tyrosine-phosphatase
MNILFICNGNVARSQEAEIFFNAVASPNYRATSAGINVKVGKPIDSNVVEVMAELGIDMSNATRKFVDEAMIDGADMVVSFKPAEELPDFVNAHPNLEFWDVPDPQSQDIEFHRQVRDDVKRRVGELAVRLQPA